MKAIYKPSAAPGLELVDVPAPTAGPGEALIKVLRTGICGTDLHIASWDPWAAANVRAPLVVGHEFVGEVVRVGPGVRSVEVGELVSGEGHIVCERCRNCRAGRRHLCASSEGIGVHRDGAFAEYLTMPAGNLWHHPPGIDLDVAAIFDPLGNAVHTAFQFPLHGEDVLISGAGPIGIIAGVIVRHVGARNVVITDVNDYRLELAGKLGLVHPVNVTSTELADVQAALGMTEGFDVGLEMSGKPRALRSMLDNMANGGKVAILGLATDEIAIDWSSVVLRMLTLQGVYGREMFETWYQSSVLVAGGVDISPVVTHRFSHRDHAAAFDVVRGGRCGKVILDWTS